MRPRTFESAVGPQIVIDGRQYVNFGGSSYLGMAAHPQVIAAGVTALHQCGSGMPIPSSHAVATHSLQDVESEGAAFFGSEAAHYFAGGYYFGLAALATLRDACTVVFFDEDAHYALRDGIEASRLRSHTFRHLDVADLASNLAQHLRPGDRPVIATDGLYSTRGEIAPLQELSRAAALYDGCLVVDESHSFGVLGERGRGAVEHHATLQCPVLAGGSLGKAFGTCGGIVPGTAEQVAALRTTHVGMGASTGLPAAAAMCAASLKYVSRHPELLQRLRTNTGYLKSGLRSLGLYVPGDDVAPIAAFAVPGRSLSALQAELMSQGIFVYHSRYIGAGSGGVIRCGIFADHSSEHIDTLLQAMRQLL